MEARTAPLCDGFLSSAGCLLVGIGLLKAVSSWMGPVESGPDPVLSVVSESALILVAALSEIAVGAFVLSPLGQRRTKSISLVWLAAPILAYRLLRPGGGTGCGCLGHWPSLPSFVVELAGILSFLFLLYLLIGGFVFSWRTSAKGFM